MNGLKNLEGSGRGLMEIFIPTFAWEELTKILCECPAEVRNEHLHSWAQNLRPTCSIGHFSTNQRRSNISKMAKRTKSSHVTHNAKPRSRFMRVSGKCCWLVWMSKLQDCSRTDDDDAAGTSLPPPAESFPPSSGRRPTSPLAMIRLRFSSWHFCTFGWCRFLCLERHQVST